MNRWFYTRPEYKEPPAGWWGLTCPTMRDWPEHHWPAHLIVGDCINGVRVLECTVFNTLADADAVADAREMLKEGRKADG